MYQHLPDRDTISGALTGALATEDICPPHWLLHQPSSICHWQGAARFQEVAELLPTVTEAGPVSARDRGRAPSMLGTLPAPQRAPGPARGSGWDPLPAEMSSQQRNVKKYMTCRKQKEMQCTCPFVTASILAQIPPLLCSFSILQSKGLISTTHTIENLSFTVPIV